jgi:hypothetical protein
MLRLILLVAVGWALAWAGPAKPPLSPQKQTPVKQEAKGPTTVRGIGGHVITVPPPPPKDSKRKK